MHHRTMPVLNEQPALDGGHAGGLQQPAEQTLQPTATPMPSPAPAQRPTPDRAPAWLRAVRVVRHVVTLAVIGLAGWMAWAVISGSGQAAALVYFVGLGVLLMVVLMLLEARWLLAARRPAPERPPGQPGTGGHR